MHGSGDAGLKCMNSRNASFDADRLRKLQLQRSMFSRAESKTDPIDSPGGTKREAKFTANHPSSYSYHSYDNFPSVYVVPDYNHDSEVPFNKQGNKNLTASTPWKLEEKPDFPVQTKYPHGMPRWGAVLATKNSEQNYSCSLDGERSIQDGDPFGIHARGDQSTCNSQKIQDAAEKAKLQSTMAAQRAVKIMKEQNDSRRYHKKGGPEMRLGSRLLGRKMSLLESARTKQSKVMETVNVVGMSRRPLSLEGSVNTESDISVERAQSLQDYVYIQAADDMSSRGSSIIITAESQDEENSPSQCDEREIIEIFEEENKEMQSATKPTSQDKISAGYDTPSLWQRATKPFNFRSSACVPTLTTSEEDHGSRYSDQSSLQGAVINNDCKSGVHSSEEEFFDPATTLETTSSAGLRTFDAGRCRELLYMREELWKKEDRGKLLSPAAAKKLAQTPSLLQVADERAIRELATRGRWLYSKETRLAKDSRMQPATVTKTFSRTVLASMSEDPGTCVKPFQLRAPAISSPLSTRKDIWHKPNGKDSATTEPENSDESCLVELGNLTLASKSSCKVEDKAKSSYFFFKARRCTIRWSPFLIFLIWAARLVISLKDILVPVCSSNAEILCLPGATVEPEIQTAGLHDMTFLTNNSYSAFCGITQLPLSHMPISESKPVKACPNVSSTAHLAENQDAAKPWEHTENAEDNLYSPISRLGEPLIADMNFNRTILYDEPQRCFSSCRFSHEVEQEFAGGRIIQADPKDFDDIDLPLMKLLGDILQGEVGRNVPLVKKLTRTLNNHGRQPRHQLHIFKNLGDALQKQSMKIHEATRNRRKMFPR